MLHRGIWNLEKNMVEPVRPERLGHAELVPPGLELGVFNFEEGWGHSPWLTVVRVF